MRSPRTTSRSQSAAAAGMCSTAPCRSEITFTRTRGYCPDLRRSANRYAGTVGEIRAVVMDYGHTIVDFRRTEEALLEAYTQIRGRIEAALEIETPEVGHLIDRVAGEVDRLVRISYEERRMEELDTLKMFEEVLNNALGVSVP